MTKLIITQQTPHVQRIIRNISDTL